jgi:hypothetical protein
MTSDLVHGLGNKEYDYFVNIDEIPANKRVSSIGEYNVLMFQCMECDYDLTTGRQGNEYRGLLRDYKHFFNQCLGFGNVNGLAVFVFKCPKCGTKFHFHARRPNVQSYFDFL